MTLNRRLILVGAASGIGAAGARVLAQQGWRLALVDRNQAGLAALQQELGERVVATSVADVSDTGALRLALNQSHAALGGVDAVWSNAGVQTNGTVEEASLEDFDLCWAINARAHVVVAQFAVPALRSAGGGSLLITASNAGLQTESRMVAYSMTKAAAVQLIRLLARDHAHDGIRVNALCPGFVDTPFNAPVWQTYGGREAFLADVAKAIPLGRMSTPDEAARHALFLLSEDASFVTGQTFVADGGELVS